MDAGNRVPDDIVGRRLIAWFGRLTLSVVVLACVLIIVSIVDQSGPIDGVTLLSRQSRGHDDNVHIERGDLPPVGGVHHNRPLECGIYDAPVDASRATHSLEHGAVWITYQPDHPEEDVEQLRERVRGQSFLLLSPFPDLRSPVVLTAWGVQLEVQTALDERVNRFIDRYLLGPLTPERGAPCYPRNVALESR